MIAYLGLFQKGFHRGGREAVPPMQKSLYSRHYKVFLVELRATRTRLGVTQQELAARLDATQSFVSKCERGERRLDVAELRLWCRALRVPMADFVSHYEKRLERTR
jgi:DNA-binding XRE family transcriptional regulator